MSNTSVVQEKLTVCRAKGLPLCEPESSTTEKVSVLTYEKKEPPPRAKFFECNCVQSHILPIIEEELNFELPPSVDEELLLEDIKDELDKWKLRVEHVDRILSLNTPECPILNPCIDVKVELQQDDVPPEILELQRNNNKLRQQLEEMQRSCTAADFSLRYLRKSLCRDMEAGLQLQRRLGELDSFQRNMEREHVLCAERYRYLQQDKYSWDCCYAYINKEKSASLKKHSKFVTMVDYRTPTNEVAEKLRQTKIHIKRLQSFLVKNMLRMSVQQGSVEVPTLILGSELTAYLQRNEEIFGKD